MVASVRVESALAVCILTDAYLPSIGGIENHTVNLARELRRQGHDVTVVTHRVPRSAVSLADQIASPVPVQRLPGGVLLYRDHDVAIDPRMFVALERLFRQRRFAIVHGQSEGSVLVWAGLAQARRHGITTVLTRHSILSAKPKLLWPVVKGTTAALLRLCSGVIAVSNACAEERLCFYGPVQVIPNGVDVNLFRPDPIRRQQKRAELGFGETDIVVGFVGRLHKSKGVGVLMDVFRVINDRRLRLVLAGPGPMRSAIERDVSLSEGAIRLLPAIAYDQVPALMNAFDIFAFPSEREAFGLALLEAMASGLPSVAFGCCGVLDVAVADVTGLLVRTPDEFAAGMRRLAGDMTLRQRLGESARQRAVARFDWAEIARKTAGFYRELAAL